MDTSANTATTIDRPAIEGKRASLSRQLVLACLAIGAIITVAATVRLAAVTYATPISIRAVEYAPLLEGASTIDPTTEQFARVLTEAIDDPALIRALDAGCFERSIVEGASEDLTGDHDLCMVEIDRALRAAPASSELWFFKASRLAADGDFGNAMMNALRNSYRTAPAEGWIASQRVLLGLRLFPALAPELQERTRSDLLLVLRDPRLSQPLVVAYAGDGSLRAASAGPMHGLPSDTMQRFVGMVREAVRDR